MTVLTTPPPVATIDWMNFESETVQVDGYIESHYNAETGLWSTPKFVHGDNVSNRELEPILNFCEHSYDGIRACRSARGTIQIFRPDFHADQFQQSCSIMSIPSMPQDHFIRCVELAISRNAQFVPPHNSDVILYVKPIIFGHPAHGSGTGSSRYILTVAVSPGRDCHLTRPLDALVMDEVDGATPNIKTSAKSNEQTRASEYGLTLYVGGRAHTDILGFSAAAFIGFMGGSENEKIHLVLPENCDTLNSVTNDSCVTLARSLGWVVEKRGIHVASLSEFSEVIAVGATADLTPVKSITHLHDNSRVQVTYDATADGKPGPMASELCQRLKDIQKGRTDDFGWCYQVRLV